MMSYFCPRCKQRAYVTDSRFNDNGKRRRYICGCGHRFSTIEVIGVHTESGIAVAKAADERAYAHEVLDKLRKEVNDVFQKAMQ